MDLLTLPRLRTLLIIIASFFGVALLIYGWSLHNPFVRWDDGMLIYENPAIRGITPSTLRWIFTHFDPELYIPVTFFSYQIDYLIGGIHPFQYHLDSLVLHTLNALLVAWLLFLVIGLPDSAPPRRGGWIALFCGLLFLVHPLNTEAVEWASGRKDVLSTFFMLSSIVGYVYWGRGGRKWLYGLSVILFALGLMSKVMIVTLPVVLLLLDWMRHRQMDRRMFLDKIPYVALSVVFGLVGLLGKETVIASSTPAEKLLLSLKSIIFYVRQFLWPDRLSLLYPYDKAISLMTPDIAISGILLLCLLGVIAWMWKRDRGIAGGLLFFLITVVPTLSNFSKGELDIYFASDRYAYVPTIGLIIALASVVRLQLFEKFGRAAVVVGCVVLTILSMVAYKQSLVWRSTQALFENVIRMYPDASYVAYNNLGNAERLDGNLDAAVQDYTKALAIRPHSKIYVNLGAVYRKRKDYAGALDAYEKALTLNPESAFAHFGIGIVYAEQGRFDEAEIEYLKAIGFDPTYEEVYVNLGALYAVEGRYEDAVLQYKKALAINDLFPAAFYNLAVAEAELGKDDDAIAHYARVIALDPSAIAARINLALLLYNNKGETEAAADQFRAVLRIDPGNAAAQSALKQMGENEV